MPPLTDLGEARVTTPEDRAVLAERRRLAQECMDLAARLIVVASKLDPDMPGVPMPGVAPVPQQRRG